MTDTQRNNQPVSDAELDQLVTLANAATGGTWVKRSHPTFAPFVQAPRANADDPYDIEVLGEDEALYSTREADIDFIVAAQPETVLRLVQALRAERAAATRPRVVIEVGAEAVERVHTNRADIDVLVLDHGDNSMEAENTLKNVGGHSIRLSAVVDGIPRVNPAFVDKAFADLPASLEKADLYRSGVEVIRHARNFGGVWERPSAAELEAICDALKRHTGCQFGIDEVQTELHVFGHLPTRHMTATTERVRMGTLVPRDGKWQIHVNPRFADGTAGGKSFSSLGDLVEVIHNIARAAVS